MSSGGPIAVLVGHILDGVFFSVDVFVAVRTADGRASLSVLLVFVIFGVVAENLTRPGCHGDEQASEHHLKEPHRHRHQRPFQQRNRKKKQNNEQKQSKVHLLP